MLTFTDYDADLDYDAILDYDGVADVVVSGGAADSGSSLKKKKKRKNKVYYAPSHIAEIVNKYNASLRIDDPEDQQKIIAAVDAFVEPKNDSEFMRRATDRYIFDVPPPPERINFQALANNDDIVEFIDSLYQKITQVRTDSIIEQRMMEQRETMERIRKEQEDDILLISLASIL